MIIQQGSIDALEQKNLKISWNLIGFCNFHCPYCLNMNGKTILYFVSEKEIQYAVNNLLNLNFETYEIYLLGGEPTLFPNFKFLVKELLKHEKIKRIYVMTNGSREIEEYNDDRVIVTVSLHPFSIDKMILKKRKNIFYNLLAVPSIFNKVQKIYDEYDVDEITVVRKPPNFVDIYEYTDDQKQWIIDHDESNIKKHLLYKADWIFDDGAIETQPKYSMMEFNQKKYLSFKNMYCLNNSLNIFPDGSYQYTCYNSKKNNKSIYEHQMNYNPELLKCNYEFCNCAGRLNILKIRDENQAKYFFNRIKN